MRMITEHTMIIALVVWILKLYQTHVGRDRIDHLAKIEKTLMGYLVNSMSVSFP